MIICVLSCCLLTKNPVIIEEMATQQDEMLTQLIHRQITLSSVFTIKALSRMHIYTNLLLSKLFYRNHLKVS